MKRTFIAFDIKPSETVKETFRTVLHTLRNEQISRADPENLHITVKFLGNTEEELISEISKITSGIVQKYEPFNIKLEGLGVFRNIHDPHVLWMGCRIENTLEAFQKELDRSLIDCGFNPEQRSFSPHLTITRIKKINNIAILRELLAQYKDKTFQEIRVNEIIYYESRLSPSGSKYIPLHRFTIGPVQS